MKSAGRIPAIRPDYTGIVIPSNIAPLNFFIDEKGREYIVRIRGAAGEQVRIRSGSPSIQIPMDEWKSLLTANRGREFSIEIFAKNDSGRWIGFNRVVNRISNDPIDGYVVYRKFGPLFNIFKKMGIYQRSLENFDEKPVYLNSLTMNNCVNCHNFCGNKTNRWLLHIRSAPGTAMLLITDDTVRKIDTRTAINGHAAYPAWHPSGQSVAFSVSNLILFYHEAGECRDVLDRRSDIVLYDIPSNTISTSPSISSPDRLEIWPAWSPDGKYLYFCSSPKLETYMTGTNKTEELAFDKVKYDLVRIAYDSQKRIWGKPETVIAADTFGLSITEPRVSPDGRFVLFTAASYSQFPPYRQDADLYLLDLGTGRVKRSELNSDRAETFHSWSSESRWVVVSSKRQDGLFARPYFSHIDSLGNASKAFVLPQEDPAFYETCIENFNVPELLSEPVRENVRTLAAAAFTEPAKAGLDAGNRNDTIPK